MHEMKCSGELSIQPGGSLNKRTLAERLGTQREPAEANEARCAVGWRRQGPGHEHTDRKRKSLLDGSGPGESGAADGAGRANFEERGGRFARPSGAAGNLGPNSRVDAGAQRR